MTAQAAVQQAQANTQDDADNIRDPVVEVGAAVEAGLDEFNGAAEGTCAYEDRQQSDAACAGEREGERREGYEVNQLVAALRGWGRRLKRPTARRAKGRQGRRTRTTLMQPWGCCRRCLYVNSVVGQC